jgi:hypothetical protein
LESLNTIADYLADKIAVRLDMGNNQSQGLEQSQDQAQGLEQSQDQEQVQGLDEVLQRMSTTGGTKRRFKLTRKK